MTRDLPGDAVLLHALRAHDEATFARLVDAWGPMMLRVALAHVPSRAVAEEVVQEAWMGVLRGIERFEGRSSLRTWVLRIVINRARTRGERESRSVPFATLAAGESHDGPAVDPARFGTAGAWAAPPPPLPEARLLERETLAAIGRAIDALPPAQRAVITLRDVEGLSGPEVSELLGLSAGNQRVLLHRARTRVRMGLIEGAQ